MNESKKVFLLEVTGKKTATQNHLLKMLAFCNPTHQNKTETNAQKQVRKRTKNENKHLDPTGEN